MAGLHQAIYLHTLQSAAKSTCSNHRGGLLEALTQVTKNGGVQSTCAHTANSIGQPGSNSIDKELEWHTACNYRISNPDGLVFVWEIRWSFSRVLLYDSAAQQQQQTDHTCNGLATSSSCSHSDKRWPPARDTAPIPRLQIDMRPGHSQLHGAWRDGALLRLARPIYASSLSPSQVVVAVHRVCWSVCCFLPLVAVTLG